MDFVAFSLAPNSSILLLSGPCIVSHSKMLILLIFSVHFYKEQVTKTEVSSIEKFQNLKELDSPYQLFRLPYF